MTKSRGVLPPRQRWTDEQVTALTRLYPDTPTADIAKQLGVTVERVYSKANLIGLKKSDAYLSSPAACRLRRGDNVGAAYRFKKGQVPANKGLKGVTYEGCIATQFKKGHRGGRAQEIYQPIGAERISKDGYLQRKVNDDMPLQRRWKMVHVLIWEATHGQVPPRHIITFRDGNKRNFSLDNLVCISMAENMQRNSVHNLPKPIAQLVQLRGALVRKINHTHKEITA